MPAAAQTTPDATPVPLLDVPFISQSEALCGGAAAAMVLRFWGERGVDAESFAHLVDRSAAGIRTTALVSELTMRGWQATAVEGRADVVRGEIARGRPVLTLIEDRPGTFHYVVIVAWHERGVVFHDPARVPFRVMAEAEFERRWSATDRWMAVIVPTPNSPPTTDVVGAGHGAPANDCDALIAVGVKNAQANDLAAAERALASALTCPGGAAARELAGVRLLQKRWPEVSDLASTAVAADPRDEYAWKLLATSLYIQEDRDGALDAWNHAGEPRLDLIRIDGLRRTRVRVAEELLGARTGDVLTRDLLLRARRRLTELPAASSTRLDYTPAPMGLAELRGAVVERPALPSTRFSLGAIGLAAAIRREVRLDAASLTGGGEEISAAYRFWPRRPRVALGVRAPAPWGGLWGVDAYTEHQPFDGAGLRRSERTGAVLQTANWATGTVRLGVAGGIDRWNEIGTFGRAGADARWLSPGDRVDLRAAGTSWMGDRRFGQLAVLGRARSATRLDGYIGVITGAAQVTTQATPRGMWSAGDTGHARATLLRAHPLLADGRLRVERLGRMLINISAEGQHWWRPRGVLRAGAAAFTDFARTAQNLDSRPALTDVDVGVGGRLAVIGMPGVVRIDLAKGLRDGATALSVVYEP